MNEKKYFSPLPTVMCKRWFCGLGMAICNTIFFSVSCAIAQIPISPDTNLPNNSIVTPNGSTFNITGGTQAGGNLFHSFREFSVPTGREAFFHNGVDIRNIITRVTGGSVSNIDGIIRTLGTANLFFINPNGIVFGPNASLDVGGSFIGSTAKSINFADGTFFSATPTDTQALLTVSVPLGLQFGSNPGEITVRGPGYQFPYDSVFQQQRHPLETSVPGLAVKSGQTLALVGGKVSVEGGVLKAPTGRIEIGSVDSLKAVNLVPVQQGWTLGYPEASSLRDIQFSGKSFVSTTGVGGGSIAIAGKNINLNGQSILVGDTLGDRDGGTTRIVGEKIVVNESFITSNTYNSGKGGQIQLDANNITLNNKSGVVVQTQGKGDGGTIDVLGKNSLQINGGGPGAAFASSAQGNSTGKAGDVNINVTGPIELRNVGITSEDLATGGKAANINITANSLELENVAVSARTTNTGKAGEININVAGSLTVKSTIVTTDTSGTGEAGKIGISANSFQVQGATISSSTGENSTGKAGEITVKVAGQLTIDQAAINTDTSGTGEAGKIDIDAGSIELGPGGALNTNTFGKGVAGTINIKAKSFLLKEGGQINSSTGANSTGKAGDITVKVAGPLTIKAPINTDTSGTGDAGKINISANSFQIQGANITSSTTGVNSTGKAGEINIDAGSVEFGSGGGLNTNTSGKRDAGTININANSFLLKGGAINSTTDKNSTGNAGNITVNVTGPLTIDQAAIKTDTSGTGNAGKINITANSFQTTSTGISSITDKNSTGNAGNISVNVTGPLTIDNATISTTAEGIGDAGQITITAESLKLDNAIINPSINASSTSGKGGDIELEIGNLLLLRHQGSISTTAGTAGAGGDGGNITINAPNGFIVAIPSENSDITANAFTGRGGKITINRSGLYGIEPRSQLTPLSDITAFSQRGISGEILINRPDVEQHLELPKLPKVFADISLLNTSCSAIASTVSDVDSNPQKSQFIVTGRGGLPPNPYDPLSGEVVWSDNRLPNIISQQQHVEKPKNKPPSQAEIVEINPATGWVFNGNGEVTLISQKKSANGLQSTPTTCPQQ